MWGIVCTIQEITSSLFDLKPPFWGHHPQYIKHCVHCMCDITRTLSMISQPLYVWYHFQYMWDIFSTIFMASYTLCMTSQPCVLITPYSAYVWHHLHYRRHHMHSITPSHNLYDFTPTSAMTSHPLYHTSHQLYFCHHTLSTEFTPTFVWYQTHYICDIIRTIYNIISTSYVIPLFYLWQHILDIWNHIQYGFQNITIPVTSQSLLCIVTTTLLRASHPLFVWHHTRHRNRIFCTIEDITSSLYETKAPFFWHNTHYILHCIDAISVTISTLLMISHQIYLWDLILYICWHHIHWIQQHIHYIFFHHSHCTCVSSPLFQWYHTLCIYDTAHSICLTSDTLYKVSHPSFMTSCHIIYDITFTVFMSSLPQYLTLHPQYLWPHNPSTYDLWTTVCISSHTFYIWHIIHHT